MPARFYIGLMSGTSADGIDLALVSFENEQSKPTVHASYFQAYSDQLRAQITALYLPSNNEIDRAFSLDVALAKAFASAISDFLQQQSLTSEDIIAIGCHGQTIRHRPALSNPFTLQIGCNQTLATLTDIAVIGDFRTKDMALGGQGAPLVPAFHHACFASSATDVFVVNIGGIANISFLPASENVNDKSQVIGFDTGPGNALLDEWYSKHQSGRFDKNGDWAATGKVNQALLQHCLANEYFHKKAPKSTGREVFNLDWLNEQICKNKELSELPPQDIQATLSQLTANSISDAIKHLSQQANIYFCGGGLHNNTLIKQIDNQLNQDKKLYHLSSTNEQAIDSDSLEATAFAWLAYAFNKKIFGNIPAVTGACKETILGTRFEP